MHIFCGIDGTANHDVTTDPIACLTASAMRDHDAAHVKRLTHIGFSEFRYFAGTKDKVTGASSSEIADKAMNWILQTYGPTPNPDRKLFLSGFSRGGAAMVAICNRLAQKKIPVQELLLFDAVDRSFWLPNDETKTIPDTVVKAFHAVRDQSMGSRQTFGNCGMKSAATRDNHLILKSFKTTHGGIGGWPNGPSRVTPGFGGEDFAYVAEHGLVMGAIKAARDPRQNFIHESMEPYPTTISPEQERQGMRAAWSWMRQNVFSTMPTAQTI